MSKKFEDYRLAISGPSGSGKTTLLKYFQDQGHSVCQVTTSSLMPEGVETHEDVIRMGVNEPQKGIDFQSQLIVERTKAFVDFEGGFVSDRSPVDSLMYYLLQNCAMDTNVNTARLIELAKQSLSAVDFTIVFTPTLPDIESDRGHRTSNLGHIRLQTICLLDLYSQWSSSWMPLEMDGTRIGEVWMFGGDPKVIRIHEPNGFLPIEDRYTLIQSIIFQLDSNTPHGNITH